MKHREEINKMGLEQLYIAIRAEKAKAAAAEAAEAEAAAEAEGEGGGEAGEEGIPEEAE